MPQIAEVAREWVQTAEVQAWLARVLGDLSGEHPVPALPPCGLCDAFVLVLLESLKTFDRTLCKNKGVAFYALLYNLLGGAAEKLVAPSTKGSSATIMLLSAATTGTKPFTIQAIARQRYAIKCTTSAKGIEQRTAVLHRLLDLPGERRLVEALSARILGPELCECTDGGSCEARCGSSPGGTAART